MKTTIRNEFQRYSKIIRHRGELPALSTIRRHIRACRPSDCCSPYSITREDGAQITIAPSGGRDRWQVVAW